MKDLNWKMVIFFVTCILSITALIIWNDYKDFRDERVSAALPEPVIVNNRADAQKTAIMKNEINALKAELEATKGQVVLARKFMENLRQRGCAVGSWDKQEFYAYSQGGSSVVCYFDLRSRTFRREVKKISEYLNRKLL